MKTFVAIDLCGPRKALLQAQYGYDSEGLPRLATVRTWSPAEADDGPTLREWLQERLILRPDMLGEMIKSRDYVAKTLLPDLGHRGEPLRRALESTPADSPRVVVFPLATTPVQRRGLPALLGHPWLHVGEAPPSGLFGLEAPVAAALEAVARRVVEPPETLVLVTEAAPAREISALTLTPGPDGDRRVLRVAIRFSSELTDPADLAPRLRRALANLGPARILAEDARSLSASFGLDPARAIDPRDWADGETVAALAALGAVRFAATRLPAGDEIDLDGRFQAVTIQGLCPRPVGVVGANLQGEWVWRRLVPAGNPLPAGKPLPSEKVELLTERPGPTNLEQIVLAECPAPDARERTWLHQDDWAATGLLLHEHSRPPSHISPPNSLETWTFGLRDQDSGRWRCPSWTIQVDTAPRPPDPPP